MSASSPQPAAPEAALRQAGDLGRRHGRAAVYWQIGDSSTGREFYQELLRGIASADPAITGLYEVPDLTARWDYERGNLAADLHLADGDPALDQAAEAYLGAAREEFWLEAARLARRRLAPGAEDETGDGTEPEARGRRGRPGLAAGHLRPRHRAEQAAVRAVRDLHPAPRRPDAPRPRADRRVHPAGPRRRLLRGVPRHADVRRLPRLRAGDLPRVLRRLPRPEPRPADPAGGPPPDRGPAPARRQGGGTRPRRRQGRRQLGVRRKHARGRVPAGASRHRRGRPRRPRRDRAARDRLQRYCAASKKATPPSSTRPSRPPSAPPPGTTRTTSPATSASSPATAPCPAPCPPTPAPSPTPSGRKPSGPPATTPASTRHARRQTTD